MDATEESVLFPIRLLNMLKELIDYNWESESDSFVEWYYENVDEEFEGLDEAVAKNPDAHHVFINLYNLDGWLRSLER
jgi:hypothetical protein